MLGQHQRMRGLHRVVRDGLTAALPIGEAAIAILKTRQAIDIAVDNRSQLIGIGQLLAVEGGENVIERHDRGDPGGKGIAVLVAVLA